MLRSLSSLGLAVVLIVPVYGLAASAGAQELPEAAMNAQVANREKMQTALQQGQMALTEIATAESRLRETLMQLKQVQSRYPDSDEIKQSIARVDALLSEVVRAQEQAMVQAQQAAAAAAGENAAITDAKVAEVADSAAKLSNLSAVVQTRANEGAQVAAAALANAPRTPPPAHHHSKGAGRSPASVGPEPTPTPTQETKPPQHGGTEAHGNTDDETAFFDSLKNGKLHYAVPTTMLWKVQSTVTVQIDGEKDTTEGPIEKQNGEAAIKVSRQMKVMVSAPENPDEFTIADESDTKDQQFVPEDGITTWHIGVTPKYTGASRKLMVRAWVIYPSGVQRELPVFTQKVDVHVPSLGECVKRLVQGDPDYWLKYGLPGGAGFVFFSGLVTGLWKWLRRKKGGAGDGPAAVAPAGHD